MENHVKLRSVRELKYHKFGKHKAYWPVSIMRLKVGIQTTRIGW